MGAPDGNLSTFWRVCDALGFIALLIAAEQFVALKVDPQHADWRVAVVLLILGPVFYSATGGWQRIRGYMSNVGRRLPRVRIVVSRTQEAPEAESDDSESIPHVELEAKRKRARVQGGAYLRDLYDNLARHAFGKLMADSAAVIRLLRQNKSDAARQLTADLMVESHRQFEEAIRPMLDQQHCATNEMFTEYLRSWGQLFKKYQIVAANVARASAAFHLPGWLRLDYQEWRELDARFVDKMKIAEHMEGANHLAVKLKEAGWGDEHRPSMPSKVELDSLETRPNRFNDFIRVIDEAINVIKLIPPPGKAGSVEQAIRDALTVRHKIPSLLDGALLIPKSGEFESFLKSEEEKLGGDVYNPNAAAIKYLERLKLLLTPDDIDLGFATPVSFRQYAEHIGDHEWPKNQR